MQFTGVVYWALAVMVALNVLMVTLTVGVKAARAIRVAWYGRRFKRLEPAVENYLITGEDQPELESLPLWQQDLFVSRLIVERMALVRGSGREHLMRMAERLGMVDRYLKHLGSRRRWRRARAADNLGYFGGERSVHPLGELLGDQDETVRAVAARALARITTPEAVRLLVGTLDDSSELTRMRVAENLERIGRLAVEPLVEILTTCKKWAPTLAAQVLGNLRAAEARPALSRAIRHTENVDLKAQAILALGKIGDPEDVPMLLAACEDEVWPARAQAANALGMIGDLSAVPTLQRLTADGEWWVRINAARALVNMGPAGERALVEVLEGEDAFARQRAATTLEAQGLTRRMVANLTAPDQKGERARRTIRALVRAGATKHLRRLARTMPEGENYQALQTLLAQDNEL